MRRAHVDGALPQEVPRKQLVHPSSDLAQHDIAVGATLRPAWQALQLSKPLPAVLATRRAGIAVRNRCSRRQPSASLLLADRSMVLKHVRHADNEVPNAYWRLPFALHPVGDHSQVSPAVQLSGIAVLSL